MTYRVVVLSDLHVGSIFGLLPPDFETSSNSIVQQNPGQKYLWRCWVDCAGWIKSLENVVALVVNGDVVDGCQRAQRGTELSMPMLIDQERAAIDTLELPLSCVPDDTPLYFIQGTEYHDAKAGYHVEKVAEALGAERYVGLGTGRYSKEVLDLQIDGVVINFAHGISVASGFYRATPVDREGIWSALAGKEGKSPKADCVVRSHAHYFVHVEHETKHILITPCWQLQTRYMRKNSVYRMQPTIGATVIEVTPEEKRNREDPIVVKKRRYDLPPYQTVQVDVG